MPKTLKDNKEYTEGEENVENKVETGRILRAFRSN
jgi:hypothetical protein